jgi:hypothetical protein
MMPSCNCCVFKAVQNCPLLYLKPFGKIYWDEKLINFQHIENDLKVYRFYKNVFERVNNLQITNKPTLFAGDRLLKLTRYYVYCYDYIIESTSGARVIYVGVFDWLLRVFATAKITCGVYPRRERKNTRGRQKYLNTRPQRVTIEMRNCTTLNDLHYDSTTASPHIEQLLDEILTFFFRYDNLHEDVIQRKILKRLENVIVSLRLTQFLKYAIQLYLTVKNFCSNYCTCGGYGDECICAEPYSCLDVFGDAKRVCSDEVFFATPEC